MLKIPIKMPKACRECPFMIPDTIFGGQIGCFTCFLAYLLKGYGGYDEKHHDIIMRVNENIKNKKKVNEDCLLVKFNKQKAR